MLDKPRLVYTGSKESEGNDYWFKRYIHIVDVDGYLIATGTTISTGYWGTEAKSKTKVFDPDQEKEAQSFALSYLLGNED